MDNKYNLIRNNSWHLVTTAYELGLHSNELASTSKSGHVKLSNAIDSTSEVVASTPKAIVDAINLVKQYAEGLVSNLISDAPENLNDFNKLALAIQSLENTDVTSILNQLGSLQALLVDKSEVGHTHLSNEITDLTNAIQTVVNAMNITVNISDVTHLQSALDLKLDISDHSPSTGDGGNWEVFEI